MSSWCKGLLLALGACCSIPWCEQSHALADTNRGTWRQTLLPRDLDRDASVDAFYDTVLDVTWLREANITNGIAGMQFDTAYRWAQNLTVGAVSGWRLPELVDVGSDGCNYSNAGGSDCGYNVLTRDDSKVYSELAHLYYVTLGNKGMCAPGDEVCVVPQSGYGLANTGDFVNLVGGVYWSATSYMPDPQFAWAFGTDGWQGPIGKWGGWWGIAVHNGDAALVPEMNTAAFMVLGLAILGVIQIGLRDWSRRVCLA